MTLKLPLTGPRQERWLRADHVHVTQAGGSPLTNTATKGLFKVSIIRAGPFTVFGKAAGDQEYYRLDLKVENVGDETGIFEPDGMLLADEEENRYALQRDASTRVLNWPLQMAPEGVERGYLLFEPMPAGVGKIRLTFNLGADDFEYELDLETG